MALVRLVIALAAGVLVVPVALAEPRAHVADGGSRAIVASPGPLVVGLHLPDRGFQVGAVRGDRVTYAAGLEAELARAVAARLGRNPRFVQIDLARLSRRGPKKWELALARLLPAATGGVTYSAPYLRGDPVVLLRRHLPPPARLGDLATRQLCTTRRSRARATIARRIQPAASPLVARDDDQLLGWIRTGRCDAALREAGELGVAGGDSLPGRIVGIVDTGLVYAVALPRRSPLAPRVDRAVAYLRTTGAIHAMAVRWLGFDPNRLRTLS